MNKTILIVDDDENLVDILKIYLEKDGYRVLEAYDGVDALQTFRDKRPDLVVLDLMLPKMDGEKVCQRIRQDSDVPIIMLTAKTREDDKIKGLDLGADDYVTKPFSRGELLARIRAGLRRTEEPQSPEEVTYGDLTVDFRGQKVLVGDRAVELTATEFELLSTMVRDPGVVFSRIQLIHAVFGYDYEGLERTIDTHVNNLRRKIETDPHDPRYIKTVFGSGYKFDPTPDEN